MHEPMPLVSAIIVVRNGERFIGETLQSIGAQSLQDWELIVVDDGSADRTAEIAEGFGRTIRNRFLLLRHPDRRNHGISASRNLGLSQARGRYIAFVDADDLWMPDKLAEQSAILEADSDLGLVYGLTQIWHSWNPQDGQADYFYPLGVDADSRYEPPRLFELILENQAQTPTTCNAMIRADLFKELGGFEPSFRGMFEDLTFFCKALLARPAYVSGKVWARYRQHAESCTATSARAGGDEEARRRFLKWLEGSLGAARQESRIRAALGRAKRDAAMALARAKLRGLMIRLRPGS